MSPAEFFIYTKIQRYMDWEGQRESKKKGNSYKLKNTKIARLL